MKFIATRDQIQDSLQSAASVAERRQTIPILANLKVCARKGMVEVTSTDLEIQLKVSSNVKEVEQEGEVTVSARKMSELCRSLPDNESLVFELIEGKLHVSAKNFKADFATLSAEDFPELEVGIEKQELKILSKDLKRLLNKTSFSMASQDVRYYLNGLLLEVKNGSFNSIATDGHRLAISCKKDKKYNIDDSKIILPRKAVIELAKILPDTEEEICFFVGEGSVVAKKENLVFSSKLIEGKFPDYEKVLPSGDESTLTIRKEVLQSALSRSSVLSNEKYRGVRLSISKDLLRLTANNPEQEMAEEEIAVAFEGRDMEIGFNIGYLLDVLTNIDTEDVEILFYGEESSCLIRETGSPLESYVVMPMKL